MFKRTSVHAAAFGLFFSLQILSASSASAYVNAVLGDVDLSANPNLPGFLPSSNQNEVLISRKQYVISYNPARREPNWVAWKVEKSDLGASGRSNNFVIDPDLEKYLAANPSLPVAVDPSDYRGSCFDRGHQAPSGDRTSSFSDNEQTFVMSNMIPQTPYLNRVIWEHLEAHTRDLITQENKIVYIVAGPIYDENFGSIGPKADIPVPSKNFKMIVILDAGQDFRSINSQTPTIAVIMPNILANGANPTDRALLCNYMTPDTVSTTDWQKYASTVSDIESISGVRLH